MREFEVLEQVWQGVTAGMRHAVFVGAEAGGGKTRFAVEAALALHGDGAGVLWGSCSDDMGLAHDPFVEPLTALLGGLPTGPATGLGARTQEVLRTLTVSGRPPGVPVDGEVLLHDVCRSVVDALALAAEDRPVLLVLEDLHWASLTALGLLKYVVSRCADQRLLLLATMRNAPPDQSAALSEVVSDLFRHDGVLRVDLPGLDVEEIATYLTRNERLPEPDARRTATLMRDSTGGNPFLLRELCRQLGPAHLADRTPPLEAPGTYAVAIRARLHGLCPTDRELLRVAAVMGEEFDLAELTEAAGQLGGEALTRSAVVAALGRCKDVGLLDATSGEEATARFPHALARRAVADTLTDLELAQVHASVGRTLVSSGTAARRRTVRLAAHFAGAAVLGHEEEARRHLTEAGDLSSSSSAHAEAADYYERAARFAVDTHARDTLRLAAARSALLAWQGDRARALDESVATGGDRELALRASVGHAAATWRDGVDARVSAALLTDCLAASPDAPEALRVVATASLARSHAWTGDPAAGRRLGARAITQARATQDPLLLAKVLSIALNDGSGLEDLDRTIDRAEELMGLVAGTRTPSMLGPACYHRCAAYYVKGDPAALAVAFRDLQQVADLTAQPFWGWVSGSVGFGLALARADFERAAENLAVAQRRHARAGGATSTSGAEGMMRFALRRETGLPDSGRTLLHHPSDDGVWPPAALALATEYREEDLARSWLHHILDHDHDDLRGSASWPAALGYLVDATAWLEDRRAAERLLAEARRYAGRNLLGAEFLHPLGSADLCIGMLESLLGLPTATERFEAAVAMNSRMGATLHLALTLAAYARHVGRHPVAGRSGSRLAEHARTLAETHGLVRVRRDLDELDARRPAWGLTSREREVLGLLGRGMSNRAIATRLVISEHTAANHVRNILMKTGSANRTQAAMLAAGSAQPIT